MIIIIIITDIRVNEREAQRMNPVAMITMNSRGGF